MKLKDQVVNLELAKKLKELKVKQSSLFWHVGQMLDENGEPRAWGIRLTQDLLGDDMLFAFSAYTVAELGEMLPDDTTTWKNTKFNWWYCEVVPKYKLGCSAERTEANAKARMLIYLIENKLITV